LIIWLFELQSAHANNKSAKLSLIIESSCSIIELAKLLCYLLHNTIKRLQELSELARAFRGCNMLVMHHNAAKPAQMHPAPIGHACNHRRCKHTPPSWYNISEDRMTYTIVKALHAGELRCSSTKEDHAWPGNAENSSQDEASLAKP